MATTQSLKALVEFAQQKMDASAKKLGFLNAKQQEAEKKLNLLIDYRRNYQAHFVNTKNNGMNSIEWSNYLAFISKLDAAIVEQRKATISSQKETELVKTEYQDSRRKLKSYNTLLQRIKHNQTIKLEKHEQKLLDEFVTIARQHKTEG